MEGHEREPCCGNCARAFEEEWMKGRTALRCGQEGIHYGRIVDIYPTGYREAIGGRIMPAWCRHYAAE